MKHVDLVIIGGGSAGLAAAIKAYDEGIQSILVLEKEKYLGGILLQCIHNGFGLTTFQEELTGPEYAHRYVEEVLKRPIDIKLETMVMEITPDKQVHYSNELEGYIIVQAGAIICATGCSERTRGAINIPGHRPAGIITAGLAQKYINIDGFHVGKRVFILGSGDIGLIMARRLRFEGVEVLGVAELMPYSNGLNRNLVQCLYDFNIPLFLHHTIKDIIGQTRIEKIVVGEVDDDFQFIPGTEKEFEIDALLLSVGLIPSNPILEKLGIALHPRTKGPWVDEQLQTEIPGIFACGNSLHVHDLVDFVSLEGEKAGVSASKYLKTELLTGTMISLKAGYGIGYVLPQ
ncbi:MAG: FAD-dependent oxidoreductase, partial [Bacilli bacterium]